MKEQVKWKTGNAGMMVMGNESGGEERNGEERRREKGERREGGKGKEMKNIIAICRSCCELHISSNEEKEKSGS